MISTIRNYKNYIKESDSGVYCYFDCLRNVLNYYREEAVYSDKDIFLLFHGNDLRYRPGEYFGYNIFSFEEFEYSNDVYTLCYKEEGIKKFNSHIVDSIKENQPVICCVNSKGLSYDKIYTKNANQMHFILIIGINDVTKQVLIHDMHLRISNEKVINFKGEMQLEELYNSLIFSQSISRDILGVVENRIPSAKEVFQKYMDVNDKIIATYLEDAFNELILLGTRDDIKSCCLKINYDLKINGPCYLLKYYYLLTDNPLFGQLDIEWVKVGNELLIYGQRGRLDGSKVNAIREKALTLLKEQRVRVSEYLLK